MSIQTTYTQARKELAKLMDEAASNNEVVVISRRNKEDVALISKAELNSIIETAHLLRSPKNAERLLKAMARIKKQSPKPKSIDKLKKEMGIAG